LKEILERVVFSLEDDYWKWLPNPDEGFTVKSSYTCLQEELETVVVVVGDEMGEVFKFLWDSPAPSKVIAFSWQLLYDRVPTRSNLMIYGIPCVDVPWECVGYVGNLESSTHLFLHFPSAMLVWREVFNLIGVPIMITPSLASLVLVLRGSSRNAKMRSGFMMIWHATIWSIWKARNSAIFATGTFLPKVIIDDIKVLSWKWSLVRLKLVPCLYYEWIWDPGDCLLC
jgi:hypothetical protein